MKRQLTLIAVLMTFFIACSAFANTADIERLEAQRLGFTSVQEMKEIHSKGWHTKERYEEDLSKQRGYSSASEMRAALGKQKEEVRREETISSNEQKDLEFYKRAPDDIGLYCRYKNPADSNKNKRFILVHSEKNLISRFAEEKSENDWKIELIINNMDKSINYIKFNAISRSSLLTKKLKPSYKMPNEVLEINRESLSIKHSIQSDFLGYNEINYVCEILDEVKFSKFVKWMHDNTKKQEQKNKI